MPSASPNPPPPAIPSVVGIDVGRSALDAASDGPVGAGPALPRRIPNDAAGIARLVAALIVHGPALIVLEATGTYHRPLLAAPNP